ncbi:nucleotidyltransferase family protein [Streptomyces rubiginosohelvolus]|uniref:nucleotidyltransferase family protein n=1 Tax=Streptomyces rubiginosohelvolus TaxID=67362 RepID=UPI0036655A4B
MTLLDYRETRVLATRYQSLSSAELPPLAQADPKEQEQAFAALVLRNPQVGAVLERLSTLDLPPWCLTAGALFQTVWNIAAGRADLGYGIRDFDVFFHDPDDLSYEAEDQVIQRCLRGTEGLGVDLEPRNQARVHLWYEAKYGRAIPPYRSLVQSLASFAFTCCPVALSLDRSGVLTVIAVHGYADLYRGILRPSPTSLAPASVQRAKAADYRAKWPHLIEESTLAGGGQDPHRPRAAPQNLVKESPS